MQHKSIESDNIEINTISSAFWNREMCIMNMKLTYQNHGDNINLIPLCIKDIRLQDKVWKVQEAQIIEKYFQIKTDSSYQRHLVVGVLESMLLNFKKMITQYQDQALHSEIQFLKRDMDKFKDDIRIILSNSSHSLSQTLAFITQFSRLRLEYFIRLGETQFIRLCAIENLAQSIKDTSHKSRDTSNTFYHKKPALVLNKFDLKLSSDVRFDCDQMNFNKSTVHARPDYVAIYYKDIFQKHRKVKQIQQDLNDTEQLNTLKPVSALRRSKNITISISNLNDPCSVIKHSNQNRLQNYSDYSTNQRSKQETNNYQRYFSNINRESQPHPQNLWDLDIQEPSLYYKSLKIEMSNQPEATRRIYIFKIYKDSLKTNTLIQSRIEQFRLNYMIYLHKHSKLPPNQNNKESSQLWNQLYHRNRDRNSNKSITSLLNYKEINRMCLAADDSNKDNNIPVRLSSQKSKIRPHNQIKRPLTSFSKFKTVPTARHEKLESNKPFYSPKFDNILETPTTLQFDYL